MKLFPELNEDGLPEYSPKVRWLISGFEIDVVLEPGLLIDEHENYEHDYACYSSQAIPTKSTIRHTLFTTEGRLLLCLVHEYGHYLHHKSSKGQFFDFGTNSREIYKSEKLAWRLGFKFAREHGLITLVDYRSDIQRIRWCLNTYKKEL